MTVVIDSGPLIDIDKGGPSAGRLLAMIESDTPVVVSAGVVAQVVRNPSRQARLMRAIRMLEVAPVEEWSQIGRLLAASRTADVVDGHVAVLAQSRRAPVWSFDDGDMAQLGVTELLQ